MEAGEIIKGEETEAEEAEEAGTGVEVGVEVRDARMQQGIPVVNAIRKRMITAKEVGLQTVILHGTILPRFYDHRACEVCKTVIPCKKQ